MKSWQEEHFSLAKPWMLLNGDCESVLRQLPDGIADTCVTSPPYFQLRDYKTGHWEGGDPDCDHYAFHEDDNINKGSRVNSHIWRNRKEVCEKCGAVYVDSQIGIEATPDEYVKRLVQVFREVRRVLKDDGTLWVNVGDSYCNVNGYARASKEYFRKAQANAPANDRNIAPLVATGLKQKDLIGIPWMLAFALRDDGWYLRQEIIWDKPNALPSSVNDRCSSSHEHIFLLSKNPKYYFDYERIEEEATGYDGRNDTMMHGSTKYANALITHGQTEQTMAVRGHERWKFKTGIKFGGNKYPGGESGAACTYSGKEWYPKYKNLEYDGQTPNTMHMRRSQGLPDEVYAVRRKRDVWRVPTSPFNGAHFATYPKKLIEPCILAGSREGGIVLDCFNGAGTTGVVAMSHGRNYIGIDLNPEYLTLTEKRFRNDAGVAQLQLTF